MLAASFVAKIAEDIKGYSFAYTNEDELQRGIESVFERTDTAYVREYRLSKKDRLDFAVYSSHIVHSSESHLVHEDQLRIAIEVKIDGSLTELTRQVHRYMQDDSIDGVVVVTPKMRLARLPEEMNGKPLSVALLSSSAF